MLKLIHLYRVALGRGQKCRGRLWSWEPASSRLKYIESQENRLLLGSEKAKLGQGIRWSWGPSRESQIGPEKCVRDNADSMMDENTNFESSYLDDYWVDLE